MSMSPPIYFLSDSHIKGGSDTAERCKQDHLISFLCFLSGRAELLYIVGDLFDFWFEYRSVIPRRGARVVFELYRLVQSGVRVRYLPGNHDPWIGSFFSEDVGVEILSDPFSVTHQGRHLYIGHGDLIYSPDRRYRLIRSLLRNPTCIRLFSLLHPDIGDRLARFVSTSSRNHNCSSAIHLDRYLAAAHTKFSEGYDLVVLGHVHLPLHQSFSDRDLIVLGDWEEHYTYAVLKDGCIALKSWAE